jgi:hypothetical protein
VPLEANATLDQAGAAKLAANVSCGEFSHTPCAQPFPTASPTISPPRTATELDRAPGEHPQRGLQGLGVG